MKASWFSKSLLVEWWTRIVTPESSVMQTNGYHLAITSDTSNNIKLYVNGEESISVAVFMGCSEFRGNRYYAFR